MRLTALLGATFALIGSTFVHSPLAAQGCLGDDGLDVTCCTIATPNLPQFPPFTIDGRYCCFFDCDVEADFDIRVTTAHIRVLCDYAFIPITVSPAATGGPGWAGNLLGKYSRTWLEPSAAGRQDRQVWRFLINGDLMPTAGASPCPIPPQSLPAIRFHHFHGHIDYACEVDAAGNQVFRMAMSLHKLPGCISHNLFSCVPSKPPASHPERSYHIIAPGRFVCEPVDMPEGPIVAEAVRSTQYAPRYRCLGESDIVQGAIRLAQRNWLCNPAAGGPLSFIHYDMVGVTVCNNLTGQFDCVPLGAGGPLPPLLTGCVALPIGRWQLPDDTFPGSRELVAHWGVMRYEDPCNPNDPAFRVVHGVHTQGVRGRLFSDPAKDVNVFMDLQDMLDPNTIITGVPRPKWGGLFISKLVFNINL